MVADISTIDNRGKAFGFYRLLRDPGSFAGPAVAGVVTSLLGVRAFFIFNSILVIVGAFLALFAKREKHVQDL